MSPEEIQAAIVRGNKDPTLLAVLTFVTEMCAITVGETNGFWTAGVCDDKRNESWAKFVVAMEKAAVPQEG